MVVDASLLLELLLGRPAAVTAVEQELEGHEHEPLYAPELIELETLNALRRTVLRGVIDGQQANAAVAALGHARLACYPHAPLRDRVWELRHNLTAYDASYLALAELLERSVFLTADAALATTARKYLGDDRVHAVAG